MKRTVTEEPTISCSCLDCGTPYEDMGLDITLSNEQWAMLNPEVYGVLCGGCISRRAAKLSGAVAIRARIEFVT